MDESYWAELHTFVEDVYSRPGTYPPRERIFAALRRTSCAKTRVMIVGQDPYPRAGHANGLAFAVPPNAQPIPGSLANIYKELHDDVCVPIPDHGIPEPLGPSLSHRVIEFGVGLTDLAKGIASSTNRGLESKYDVPGFIAKMEEYQPRWIAFHGKDSAKPVSTHLGYGSSIHLGRQTWQVAPSRVFVVPSMSASNRNPKNWDGRNSRESWWFEFADLWTRNRNRRRNKAGLRSA